MSHLTAEEEFKLQLAQLGEPNSIKLGLERMQRAADLIGNPEREMKFIHIAGTNGKGTTADFISQGLELLGYKVAIYASPHMCSYTERYKVNGVLVSIEMIIACFHELRALLETQVELTEFEWLTLIAIRLFSREKVDYVLWETGLGGRLDATNIVIPIITVITTISYDHQAFLGDTLEKIAFEKSGIIKDNVPLVHYKQSNINVEEIILKQALLHHVDVHIVVPYSLDYLDNNRRLAERVVQICENTSGKNPQILLKDLKTRVLGRRMCVRHNPDVYFEAAHNVEGVDACVKWIGQTNSDFLVLFAATKRPELKEMVSKLADVTKEMIIYEFSFVRSASIKDYSRLKIRRPHIKYVPTKSVEKSIKKYINEARKPILVVGSIYFLGEVLTFLRNDGLINKYMSI